MPRASVFSFAETAGCCRRVRARWSVKKRSDAEGLTWTTGTVSTTTQGGGVHNGAGIRRLSFTVEQLEERRQAESEGERRRRRQGEIEERERTGEVGFGRRTRTQTDKTPLDEKFGSTIGEMWLRHFSPRRLVRACRAEEGVNFCCL